MTWFRLKMLLYKWHAEDAWLASLIIRAQTNANDNILAQANEIVNPVFEAQPALA